MELPPLPEDDWEYKVAKEKEDLKESMRELTDEEQKAVKRLLPKVDEISGFEAQNSMGKQGCRRVSGSGS